MNKLKRKIIKKDALGREYYEYPKNRKNDWHDVKIEKDEDGHYFLNRGNDEQVESYFVKV